MFGDKVVADGEKIVCHLSFGKGCFVAVLFIVNHESGVVLGKNPFQQFDSESRQAVSVGNHNLFDASAVDEFQKGFKLTSFEIDTGSGVKEEFVLRIVVSEKVQLSVEVCALMGGTNTGVTDSLAFSFLLLGVAEDASDVVNAVQPTSAGSTADTDLFLICPRGQCGATDAVL